MCIQGVIAKYLDELVHSTNSSVMLLHCFINYIINLFQKAIFGRLANSRVASRHLPEDESLKILLFEVCRCLIHHKC